MTKYIDHDFKLCHFVIIHIFYYVCNENMYETIFNKNIVPSVCERPESKKWNVTPLITILMDLKRILIVGENALSVVFDSLLTCTKT